MSLTSIWLPLSLIDVNLIWKFYCLFANIPTQTYTFRIQKHRLEPSRAQTSASTVQYTIAIRVDAIPGLDYRLINSLVSRGTRLKIKSIENYRKTPRQKVPNPAFILLTQSHHWRNIFIHLIQTRTLDNVDILQFTGASFFLTTITRHFFRKGFDDSLCELISHEVFWHWQVFTVFKFLNTGASLSNSINSLVSWVTYVVSS